MKKDSSKIKPICFVDSSVFLEVLFEQQHNKECFSFFRRAVYKYSLMTSTSVMGEVVRGISRASEKGKPMMYLALGDLILTAKLAIMPVSFGALGSISAIRELDQYLPSADCLVFSSVVSEKADLFVTLDSHFTQELAHLFKISIKQPLEA